MGRTYYRWHISSVYYNYKDVNDHIYKTQEQVIKGLLEHGKRMNLIWGENSQDYVREDLLDDGTSYYNGYKFQIEPVEIVEHALGTN